MEYIIILLEVLAFASLVAFAVILNSRRFICRPIHLLNFGIWPLSALGVVSTVIFVNLGARICYMPHVMWHALLIVLLAVSFESLPKLGLKCIKQRNFARFFLLFAAFSEVLAVATNMLWFIL